MNEIKSRFLKINISIYLNECQKKNVFYNNNLRRIFKILEIKLYSFSASNFTNINGVRIFTREAVKYAGIVMIVSLFILMKLGYLPTST